LSYTRACWSVLGPALDRKGLVAAARQRVLEAEGVELYTDITSILARI